MAEQQMYIPKDRTLTAAENYSFLRGEGLRYIEELAHELWTDYNTHDPGITILEALCYAITELAYRTSFGITDLLADERGAIGTDQAFFTPREIFTSEPFSLTDYRKLLIDLKGVSNAWIYPALNIIDDKGGLHYWQSEVPLYPECKKDRLTFKKTDHDPVDVRGLYHVKLDLDETDLFGDLNNSNIDYTIYGSELRGAQIECVLPRYNEVDFPWLSEYYNESPESVTATPVKWDNFGRPTRWSIILVYKKGGKTTSFQYQVRPELKLPVLNFEVQLEQELKQKITQQQILELYYNKTLLIRKIVQAAWETLHAHRNLCEDWWTVDTIKNTPVAICADVEVTPESDIEKVYAAIIVAIENYLNPPVRFYSLGALREKGYAIEDIFEGPKLAHGFVLDEELEKATLRKHLYVSDLINSIMDIEGVVAIKNILLTKYDDNGQAVLPSQKWCLHIDEEHKPVLDVEKSKLLFFKNNLPYKVRHAEAKDTILFLHGQNATYKILGGENDLPLPLGTHFELRSYSSVQHDLPDTYGTNQVGLPDTVSEERKAKAKQLKAYLLFYDQILAGYFSQLQHAKDLLGLGEIRQSYFQQFLQDWTDDPENGISNVAGLYADPASLQRILEKPLAGEDGSITRARRKLVEDESVFHDRRNRFLDHLIARFAESFNDYVLMLYSSREKLDQEELIRDKIRFIKEYPVSSSRRGTAYNMLGELWNTSNVSGLEKRVAQLTGIDNSSRRNLFCYPLAQIVNEGTDANPKFTFVLRDKNNRRYLQPVNPLDTYEKAERLLNDVYENMLVHEFYRIKEEPAGTFHIYLANNNGLTIATCVRTYTQKESASRFINSVLKNFKPTCDEEGLHLIEHFLLRPLFVPPVIAGQEPEDVYRLLKVCLPTDCLFCGEEDPFSFRVSLFLPYWPKRFRDSSFRRFFETIVRREAPAHVHAKVCWLSFTDMQRLEAAYGVWLEALKAYRQNQTPDAAKRDAIRKASNDLIDVMDSVTTVYPEATLHDCEEGTTNPVRLGSTSLGSF